jgi:hypothetical protein
MFLFPFVFVFFVRNFLEEVSDTFKNLQRRGCLDIVECLCAVPLFFDEMGMLDRFIRAIAPATVLVPPPKTGCRKDRIFFQKVSDEKRLDLHLTKSLSAVII